MYDSYYDYSSYYSSTDPVPFLIISVVAALVMTILLFILVLPDRKRPTLNGFFKGVADIFNFRTLLIEKIVKFLYTFTTIASVLFGFFMLFMQQFGRSLALYGLLLMFVSPIVIRIIYEISMMAILLVKNVIEINNKLGYKKDCGKKDMASPFVETRMPVNVPVQTQTPVEMPISDEPKFLADDVEPEAPTVCANCGTVRTNENAPFCTGCGTRF